MLSNEEKQKQFGEVFTPLELVDQILNKFESEIFGDPNKTWIDNSCGVGVFLVEIKKRLMTGLEKQIPDSSLREKHILEHQIFGVEIQEDNWRLCRINLGLTAGGNDGNIVCADALRYDYSFEKDISGGYVIRYKEIEDLFDWGDFNAI